MYGHGMPLDHIVHYTLHYAQPYCTLSILDLPLNCGRIVPQSSPRRRIRCVARQIERVSEQSCVEASEKERCPSALHAELVAGALSRKDQVPAFMSSSGRSLWCACAKAILWSIIPQDLH